jgi:hypothetical protein
VESVDGGVIQLYFFQQLTHIPLPTFILSLCFHAFKIMTKVIGLPFGTMIAVAYKPEKIL